MNRREDIATALLGIVIALILWITILSREKLIGTPIKYNLFHAFVSFIKETQRGKLNMNFLGNIVLFIPVGVLMPLATGKQRWQWVIGAGCGFSLLIEIIQLISIHGCFDPDDLILNTLGTGLGFVLFLLVMKHRKADNA